MVTSRVRVIWSCLLFAALVLSALAQPPSDPEGRVGAELRTWLKDNWYTPYHTTLGYSTARMYMYNYIDNDPARNSIFCVYGGYEHPWTYGGTGTNPPPINCEHTIPQSFFNSDDPMVSDIFHLYPSYDDWNSTRSNYPFSEIPDDSATKWMIGTTLYTTKPTGDIDLYSEFMPNTFEPREDHKGNLARSVFYFYTMYPSYNMSQVGDLATFLAWHAADPVDAAEQARNNSIETYQGNRNPFIDHPDWVARAWDPNANYPVITDVLGTPEVPGVSESLTVTATVTDDEGLSAVEIHYTGDGVAQTPIAMTTSRAAYTGQIPAQASGAEVEYQVKATDTDDQTATSATYRVCWVIACDDYPEISGLSDTPDLPTSAQSLTVNATVTDDQGLTTVEIQYTANGVPQTPIAMTPTRAGYTGTIPPQGDRVTVSYVVAATDTAAQTTTSPAVKVYWGVTDILTFRGLGAGAKGRIEGVVTLEPGILSTTYSQIFIQDDTGGMCVYKSGTPLMSVARHDRVQVVGTLKNYNGLLEIDPLESYTNLGPATPVEPLELTLEELGEENESMLAVVYGVTLNAGQTWPATGANATLAITDFWGNAGTLYIDRDTNIDGSPAPTAPFALMGVVSQYNAMQMLPRNQNDIIRYTVGDLNTDGNSDLLDLTILINYLSSNLPQGTIPFEALITAADINEDSLVNGDDLLVLADYLAGNL